MDDVRKEDLKQADQQCHEKAKANGELTFTLRAQDLSGPRVIGEWIKMNIESAPEHKLRQALAIAIGMRDTKGRKLAD